MLKQKDWVNILSEKVGCSKKEAKEYYDFIFDSLKNTISLEESIKLSGFGVLKLRKTKDKEQINLVTGQVELVPEHNVITFKPYFEIEPKPKAIEVEDENVNAAFDIAAAVSIAAETAAQQVNEEPVIEAVVKEAPVEEVSVEENDVQPSELSWVFNNEKYTENDIKKVLMQKTELSEADVEASLAIVKNSLRDVAPQTTTIQVVEEKDTFNFVFEK